MFLGHPNIKLFVSHGGLMGTQEALYCGVPTLGIPFFADQFLNVKQCEAMGLSIQITYDEITKENMLKALESLMEDPKYLITISSNVEQNNNCVLLDIKLKRKWCRISLRIA